MDTYTENGMPAYTSTESVLLDFFSGITRDTSIEKAIELFKNALSRDFKIAMAILLNMRDCRDGKQEKNIPQRLMAWLKQNDKIAYKNNLESYINNGYFKDLLIIDSLQETKDDFELELFAKSLKKDFVSMQLENNNLTLASKWAPTENRHFDKKHKSAKRLAKLCGLSMKEYRKKLSELREKLKIVERLETLNKWSEIDYQTVPATCMKKQKNAFIKHDNARFNEYLEKVISGKAKMNTSGVQIHELLMPYINGSPTDTAIDVQFSEIITKIQKSGSFKKAMAIIDVSGSMSGIPMIVAITLGLAVSLLTEGNFNKKFITFSHDPQLCDIKGDTLSEMVRNLKHANWGMNTNLIAIFDLLLNFAKMFSLSQDQMINKLFIFTDMQFDQADNSYNSTAYNNIKQKYQEAGYTLPTIIFWNLRDTKPSFPVKANTSNVALMSGFSAEMLKLFMETPDELTPYNMMMKALEKYLPQVIC